ncbi:MAG: hypothetical protein H0U59_07170 [Gemmatimonadaceae bacterium]|nr:hypothetical protein [Gemmatimonadaceae bacterium]
MTEQTAISTIAALEERIAVLEAFVRADDVLHDWRVFGGILADDDDGAMRRATLQQRKDAYEAARAAVGELGE